MRFLNRMSVRYWLFVVDRVEDFVGQVIEFEGFPGSSEATRGRVQVGNLHLSNTQI